VAFALQNFCGSRKFSGTSKLRNSRENTLFVTFVVNPFFFAPLAFFAVKSLLWLRRSRAKFLGVTFSPGMSGGIYGNL
jgi:hypothetical protein